MGEASRGRSSGVRSVRQALACRARAAGRGLRRRWLAALATVSLVALVVAVDPIRLLGALSRLRPAELVLMAVVAIAIYICRSLAWWVTLRRLGVGVSLWRTIAVEFTAQTLIFMPAGDLVRVAILRRLGYRERGVGELTGTVAIQELIFMGMMSLGILPRVASQPGLPLLALVMTIGYLGLFVILLWAPAYAWAVATVLQIPGLRRFEDQLRAIRPAFVALVNLRTLAPLTALMAAATGLSFLLFDLALNSVSARPVDYASAAFVLSLSFLLSGMSLIPGGAAVFEGLVTVLLLSAGVTASVGAAAGLLFRGFNDVLLAGIGVAMGLASRPRPPFNRNSSRAPAPPLSASPGGQPPAVPAASEE